MSRVELLDGNTFDAKQTWTQSPALRGSTYSISDEVIAQREYKHDPAQLELLQFGAKEWRNIGAQPEKGCLGKIAFVSDDCLAYACKGFRLVSIDGKVVMNDRFLRSERIGAESKFAVARDTGSAALSLEDAKDNWDTGGRLNAIHIAVYSLSLKKRVTTLNVRPLPKEDFDFALSPDGSKLAVLNDRNLSLYSVPTGD